MELATECIYALKHSQKLDAAHQSGGRGELAEGKSWSRGRTKLAEARKKGVRLPVVFAAAENIDGLIYWALIDDIVIDSSRSTTVRYSELRPIAGKPPLSTLRLPDTKKRRGKRLSDLHKRSYVFCVTPVELLREENNAAAETLDVEDLLPVGREGSRLARLHFCRKRKRSFVLAKRGQVLAATGRLACEACGFDFREVYGGLGDGFCEVHHRIPLSEAEADVETKLEDLGVVCSNYHSMLHRAEPFLTIEQLQAQLSPANDPRQRTDAASRDIEAPAAERRRWPAAGNARDPFAGPRALELGPDRVAARKRPAIKKS